MTVRMNVECHFVIGNPFVRELSDEVSGDRAAKLPSVLNGQRLGMAVEFAAGDVRALLKMSFPVRERLADVFSQFVLCGIGAENVGSTEVCFPFLKYRSKVQEQDVVSSEGQVGRIFSVRLQGISAGADDSLVPIGVDSVHLFREGIDVLVQVALGDVRANQSPRVNLMEQVLCLGLRYAELVCACLF